MIEYLREITIWVVLVIFVLPLVIYLCVKVATVAYYDGKRRSQEHAIEEKDKDHGPKES